MSSSHLLLDKRILDRNLAKGLLTKKDYEKHLAALSDASGNAEFLDPVTELEEELNPSSDAETGGDAGESEG